MSGIYFFIFGLIVYWGSKYNMGLVDVILELVESVFSKWSIIAGELVISSGWNIL